MTTATLNWAFFPSARQKRGGVAFLVRGVQGTIFSENSTTMEQDIIAFDELSDIVYQVSVWAKKDDKSKVKNYVFLDKGEATRFYFVMRDKAEVVNRTQSDIRAGVSSGVYYKGEWDLMRSFEWFSNSLCSDNAVVKAEMQLL